MDAERSRNERSAEPSDARRHGEGQAGLASDAALDEALIRRLDRIVALAARRAEPAPHGELLDELRGLVRAAEQLRSATSETPEEVVERPARRLHGT